MNKTTLQTNERAWLYLVSDVLTWQNGIGQYLDDPRVQELAKKLCSEYTQKLYNPSVLSSSSNIGKYEQKYAGEIEPRFKVGDWIVYEDAVWKVCNISLQNYYELLKINNEVNTRLIKDVDENAHLWDIAKDAKEGDVLTAGWWKDKDFWQKIIIFKKYHSEGIKWFNMPCVEGYGNTFKNGKLAINEEVPFYSKTWTCNLHPATKEQCIFLFYSMKENGYEWDGHIVFPTTSLTS